MGDNKMKCLKEKFHTEEKWVKISDIIPSKIRKLNEGYFITKDRKEFLGNSTARTSLWNDLFVLPENKDGEYELLAFGNHTLASLKERCEPDKKIAVLVIDGVPYWERVNMTVDENYELNKLRQNVLNQSVGMVIECIIYYANLYEYREELLMNDFPPYILINDGEFIQAKKGEIHENCIARFMNGGVVKGDYSVEKIKQSMIQRSLEGYQALIEQLSPSAQTKAQNTLHYHLIRKQITEKEYTEVLTEAINRLPLDSNITGEKLQFTIDVVVEERKKVVDNTKEVQKENSELDKIRRVADELSNQINEWYRKPKLFASDAIKQRTNRVLTTLQNDIRRNLKSQKEKI